MIILANPRTQTPIGRLGENEARVIRFPISDILADFPDATFALLNRRPQDSAAYPVDSANVTIGNGYLDWTPTSGDLALRGQGECEIIAYQGGAIAKTVIYPTTIDNALDGSGTPPAPWESWVQSILDAAADVEDAVMHNPTIIDGVWYVWDADNGAYVSTGVDATGPQGETGPQGPRGEPGRESVLTATLISGEDYMMQIEGV